MTDIARLSANSLTHVNLTSLRRGRNVELTNWGRVYHSGIAVAFAELRNAQNNLAKARMKSGLVVSCLPSLAIKWIGPQLLDWQISTFEGQYPPDRHRDRAALAGRSDGFPYLLRGKAAGFRTLFRDVHGLDGACVRLFPSDKTSAFPPG